MGTKPNIWDEAVDRRFVRASDGRTAWYPFGRMRQGYWLESPEFADALHRRERRRQRVEFIVVAFLAFGALVLADARKQHWRLVVGVLVLALLWTGASLWRIRRLTRGLTAVAPPPGTLTAGGCLAI